MSFALKPINKSIQHKLEEKSKIFSRETSALNIQAAGGIPNALKDVQSRTPWMRWISGDMDPVVILGGVGMNDGGLGYSLAKGFKEVYVPPDTAYRDRMRYSPGQSRPVGPFFKPLAGVKSITTSFSGATKALRKTVITWTVFDLNELEILTPHFLSPGKWSMVEIGWNYDGKNFINLLGDKFFNVKREGDNSPAQAELDRFEDFPEVDEIIYQNRGDYDVFSGIISNFEYSVREDGGFDCTTTLSNHGISLLDAGKDSTTFTVDTALTNVKVDKDPDFIAQLGQDNINIAIARLATYMRVQVTDDSNKLLPDMKVSPSVGHMGNFYGPTPTNWFTYAGVKGKYVKKDDEVEFKGLESAGEETDMMTKDNPAASWVRWGWFEDNVLSRYVGYATMTTDELGSIDGVDEIKLKFRSIDSVLVTDENDGVLGEKKKDEDGKVLKESVRILSHEKILTTDVNKFILIGKTPTLDKDEGVYGNLGKFLKYQMDAETTLANYKFQVPEEDSASEIEEGYIRNIFFNVRWLQEQFEGVGTLKEAIDNIWNAFNAEYQNYWQFDVVGDINDTTIARIVDTNNSRYSVDDYEISTINLKNPSNSRIGCYQFPTWTKDSIVSSMDYSVTIPSSQVAVAALSGGKLDSSKIAQRNRGNIDVQTFVKGMHKSFEDRKERFFDNITRIAEYAHVSEVATFGRSDGNENEKLEGNSGPNIIGKINERDPDLLHGVGGDLKESTLPKYVKVENTIVLSNAHKFLQTHDKSKSGPWPNPDWPTLYENGAIQSSDKNVNYKRTMLGIMHTSPKESKGALTDLLNGIAELKLTIDGTAGIFPGDAFTSKHLPKHLLRPLPGTKKTIDGKATGGKLPLLFQATNVEQALGPDGWKTTVTGQPRMNHKHVYQPTEEEAEQNTFREELRGEIVAGAVTKEGLLTRLFENRNILGINQQYLNYYQMFVGIRKVIDDEYFSPNGQGPRSTPFLDMRTEFGRSENKGKLDLKVWVTKGSGKLKTSTLETQTHDARYTPALFKDINGLRTIEEAMRFAMYNGILYSMPHPKVHNSQYNPYTSIDGSYQCVSYNLFKGDSEGMNRWEAKAGVATNSTVPVYTRRYIDDMKRKLNEFSPTLSYTGKGSVEKWGIDGLYTPMAYIRRGKDVMKKFMRQSGTDIDNMFIKMRWDEAKKWQQIIKVTTSNDGETLDTGYWDGVSDGPYKYKNIKINPDSYQIWFDYFKCMFNSYLGITWEERAQLVEHPTISATHDQGEAYWEALKAAVWKSDETKKINPKIGRDENERAELIAMMDNERMFKNGVAKFSVDNEIHKFLLHMKDTGFFIIPEVMWWKDYQSGADSESMDWMKLVSKRPGEWDKKYDNKSGNASWELWPYESGGDGQKKLYYIDSTGKKISVDDR